MQAASGPALAQAASRPVRVVLDGVEPPVAGLRAQVYDDDRAPQLVLENRTGRTLEVLDGHGRAFVRIGAGGVEADVAAAAWYRSLSPGGATAPHGLGDGPAHWQPVRARHSWGWFDPRLDTARVPAGKGAPASTVGRWSVSARLGADRLEIHGHFLYQPKPAGVYLARLAGGPDLTPHVRVTVSPGRPPALTLENSGDAPVLVLGAHDEAFLRISADGVEADLASPTWQDLARYRGLPAEMTGVTGGQWRRISLAPRYTWLERRADLPSVDPNARLPDNARALVKGWGVPVQVGPRFLAIQGVVEWVPLPGPGA